MSSYEVEHKKYHDENILAAAKARLRRNVLGGTVAAATLSLAVTERILEWDVVVPSNTLSSIAQGVILGVMSGKIVTHHYKSNEKHEKAVWFAASEVIESQFKQIDPPEWAANTLAEVHKTANEVLRPQASK